MLFTVATAGGPRPASPPTHQAAASPATLEAWSGVLVDVLVVIVLVLLDVVHAPHMAGQVDLANSPKLPHFSQSAFGIRPPHSSGSRCPLQVPSLYVVVVNDVVVIDVVVAVAVVSVTVVPVVVVVVAVLEEVVVVWVAVDVVWVVVAVLVEVTVVTETVVVVFVVAVTVVKVLDVAVPVVLVVVSHERKSVE